MAKQVVILDAGSQFCGQIDRVVHELEVASDILPLSTPASELSQYNAIIISGGPDSVNEANSKDCDPAIFSLNKPILGICYGMQLIAKHLGGSVGDSGLREDGMAVTNFIENPLFTSISGKQTVWMSHGDSVHDLPTNFEISGSHEGFISAISNTEQRIHALQFHPEVHNTPCGKQIISNFLFNIADLARDFSAKDRLTSAQQEIKEVVGDKHVIMYLSGGVDSTVMAMLIAKTLKDPSKIHAYHIDNGFMREGESQAVAEALKAVGVNINIIEASDKFLNSSTTIDDTQTNILSQTTDPQQKRKIIGDCFANIREGIIDENQLPADTVLAQGTLRPDIIESGSTLAGTGLDVIKTHHNDTEEIRKLREQSLVVEPLKYLYKDQVRALGHDLGLPENLINRHPFPGPGLAIRIICSDGSISQPDKLVKSQAALDTILSGTNVSGEVLPIRTVGVQGDGRTYAFVATLRCADPNWEQLALLARTITNAKINISRVAYAFLDKPITSKVVPTLLNHETTTILKHADKIVRDIIKNDQSPKSISQMPVILVPVSYGEPSQRTIAIRPFITPDFMTGIAALPDQGLSTQVFEQCVSQLIKLDNISQVLLDLTSKPPGTTEWE